MEAVVSGKEAVEDVGAGKEAVEAVGAGKEAVEAVGAGALGVLADAAAAWLGETSARIATGASGGSGATGGLGTDAEAGRTTLQVLTGTVEFSLGTAVEAARTVGPGAGPPLGCRPLPLAKA